MQVSEVIFYLILHALSPFSNLYLSQYGDTTVARVELISLSLATGETS